MFHIYIYLFLFERRQIGLVHILSTDRKNLTTPLCMKNSIYRGYWVVEGHMYHGTVVHRRLQSDQLLGL